LTDLYWLAIRVFLEVPSADRAVAISATVSWLHGGRDAPITARPAGVASSSQAEAELWAARRVIEPEAVDLECITVALGVRHTDPVSIAWAVGVAQTLEWVLGTARYALPPMDLPRRGTDGKLCTVDELYQATNGHHARSWGSVERFRAYRDAELAVMRSRRLAQLIDAVRHRVLTGQTPPPDPRDAAGHRQMPIDRANETYWPHGPRNPKTTKVPLRYSRQVDRSVS
jgi:hypothetical protein